MDEAHPQKSPMVVRSLDPDKDEFKPCDEGEKCLGPETPYLAAIGALMYLANCTRPNIAFAVNLLARFNAKPTKRHWNDVKHILRYIKGTEDLRLFYKVGEDSNIKGYVDACYLFDPLKGKSQTCYVFLRQGATISWKSTKQSLAATSSNHSEIIALHEASHECVWLRLVDGFIKESCGLSNVLESPTVIYEDNAACIVQIKASYIKGDRIKHILPKFFFTHELLGSDIDVIQVRSSDNLANLFTKSLPTSRHKQIVQGIGMRRFPSLPDM
jgi:hypothetical protein